MGQPAIGEAPYGEKDAMSYLTTQLFNFGIKLQKLRATTAVADAQINNSARTGYESGLWVMANALFDTLLPKLNSGEQRMAKAEVFLGART